MNMKPDRSAKVVRRFIDKDGDDIVIVLIGSYIGTRWPYEVFNLTGPYVSGVHVRRDHVAMKISPLSLKRSR